jgi:hypothetical protein
VSRVRYICQDAAQPVIRRRFVTPLKRPRFCRVKRQQSTAETSSVV